MNVIDKSIYEGFEPLPMDIGGWNGDRPIFDMLVAKIRPKLIIEVGTWKGQSAVSMGNALKRNGIDGQIICVDTWLGAMEFWGDLKETPERDLMLKHGYPQVYYQFLSNVVHSELQNVIRPLPLPSLIAARLLNSQGVKADLIYIDASHDQEDVYADIQAYWPLLNDGGTMFGDDYADWQGVREAVNQFAVESRSPLKLLDCGHFWAFQKS